MMIKPRRRATSMMRKETSENRMRSMNFSIKKENRPTRMMMKKQRSMKSTLKSTRLEKLVMQRLSTPSGCSGLNLDQRSYQSSLAQLEMLSQSSSRSSCCRLDYISSGSTDYSNGTSVETSRRHGNIFNRTRNSGWTWTQEHLTWARMKMVNSLNQLHNR